MDCELICNFRKCRKSLKNQAWVTSCSHIFCDEDGSKEFRKSFSCPACETSLSGKYDLIKVDLQASEQYKSMALAGQKPETIMDICSRALTFWTYQVHQEQAYQEYVSTKAKERNVQLEQYYEQIITRTQAELSSLKSQMSATRKELENMKKQYNEAQEKCMVKSRQYHKLQTMYDSLRRKFINPAHFDSGDGPAHVTPNLGRGAFQMQPFHTAGDDILRMGHPDNMRPILSSPACDRDFVLRPNVTPVIGSAETNMVGPAALSRFNSADSHTDTGRLRKP